MAKRKRKEFTSTCPKDYDRHIYKIVLKDGKEFIVEDYAQVRAYWNHQFARQLDHVEVMDK